MSEILFFFWFSLGFILYTYIGYPLLLWLQARFFTKKIEKQTYTPFVSVVISALNEEQRIGRRLENLLEQQYPGELEILVVSDGSTDRTGEIVRSFSDRNVRLLEIPEKKGKASALNLGIAEASGEIVVFTDARQRFEPDAIFQLVANFSDPFVGCVSGELMFQEDTESSVKLEMGAYWKYEKWIRKMESRAGSVVGATGAIYAIRRELYTPLPEVSLLDDVLSPMNVVGQGFRVVFDSKAIAYDILSDDVMQEWRRKVRTLTGNWQLLSLAPWLLVPWRNKEWGRFLSHKVCRILVPFFLVSLFALSLKLEGLFYEVFLLVQIVCYGLAIIGYFFSSLQSYKIFSIPFFFMVMNIAALFGFFYWISGTGTGIWKAAGNKQKGFP